MVVSLGFAKSMMRTRFSKVGILRINWRALGFYRSTQPTLHLCFISALTYNDLKIGIKLHPCR